MTTIINSTDYSGGFVVTGIDTNGKRFKRKFSPINMRYAFCINVWRGHVWGINKEGKRKMLKSVCELPQAKALRLPVS